MTAWGPMDGCEGCRLNYRTFYMRFQGVALKVAAMVEQDFVEAGVELKQVNRDAQDAATLNAIGRASFELALVSPALDIRVVQSAGCPVCGLSEGLVGKPLSLVEFDAAEEHEAAVESLLDELAMFLRERVPEPEKGSGELFPR